MNNKLIILCGPSGAGKTTVAHHLLEHVADLSFSISATTRPMRPNEENGIDYHFLRKDDFMERIQSDEFIEYEEVYPGILYGTLKSEMDRLWGHGKIPLLDIDVMGALNIKKDFAPQALTIFLHPVSIENLRERLASRKTENDKSFESRIRKAEQEIAYSDSFDCIIYNDNLETTTHKAEEIVKEYISKAIDKSVSN